MERYQAVVYKGPWRTVTDDDGHTLHRGRRMAVCDKTYHIYEQEPYLNDFELIEPYEDTPLSEATTFDCRRDGSGAPVRPRGSSTTSRKPPRRHAAALMTAVAEEENDGRF